MCSVLRWQQDTRHNRHNREKLCHRARAECSTDSAGPAPSQPPHPLPNPFPTKVEEEEVWNAEEKNRRLPKHIQWQTAIYCHQIFHTCNNFEEHSLFEFNEAKPSKLHTVIRTGLLVVVVVGRYIMCSYNLDLKNIILAYYTNVITEAEVYLNCECLSLWSVHLGGALNSSSIDKTDTCFIFLELNLSKVFIFFSFFFFCIFHHLSFAYIAVSYFCACIRGNWWGPSFYWNDNMLHWIRIKSAGDISKISRYQIKVDELNPIQKSAQTLNSSTTHTKIYWLFTSHTGLLTKSVVCESHFMLSLYYYTICIKFISLMVSDAVQRSLQSNIAEEKLFSFLRDMHGILEFIE